MKKSGLRRDHRAIWAVLLLGFASGVVAAQEEPQLVMRFDRLHGIYENLAAVVEPVRSGPVTLRMSSPQHRLELLSSQLELTPREDGIHDAKISLRFRGQGDLHTELDFGGLPASFEDKVVFPEQDVEIEGLVRLIAEEEGYRVVVERTEGFTQIEARSVLSSEIVSWCNRLARFLRGDAGCDALDEALSHPKLPLPGPGEEFVVLREQLTDDERAQIDVYLAPF